MKGRGKVLVVEDYERWVRRLRTPLEEKGFHVEVVKTLEEAIELLEQRPNFHFATIDLQLDERTLTEEDFEGWKVLAELLKIGANRTMSIMVITGFPGEKLERYIHGKMTSNRLKAQMDYKVPFFMEKSKFDREKFLEMIIREVDKHDQRFVDDHRG